MTFGVSPLPHRNCLSLYGTVTCKLQPTSQRLGLAINEKNQTKVGSLGGPGNDALLQNENMADTEHGFLPRHHICKFWKVFLKGALPLTWLTPPSQLLPLPPVPSVTSDKFLPNSRPP
jgi:hypothetical protein